MQSLMVAHNIVMLSPKQDIHMILSKSQGTLPVKGHKNYENQNTVILATKCLLLGKEQSL